MFLRGYGTDGKQALSNAAASAFPFATHLRCANHFRDNITTNLRKQLLPEAVIKGVLSDIFGTASEKGSIWPKPFENSCTSSLVLSLK